MTPETRNELMAQAMVGRYRLGYIELSMLMAGTLFEVIINRKLVEYDRWTENRLDNPRNTLEVKINRACEISSLLENDSLFSNNVRDVFIYYRPNNQRTEYRLMSIDRKNRFEHICKRLHNFRWLRNQIVHGKLSSIQDCDDKLMDDLILYVWRELAPANFKEFHSIWSNNACFGRLVDTIEKHTADYMIRAIDEVDIRKIDDKLPAAQEDWGLGLSDFANLFGVRDKLVLLKNHLTSWLKSINSDLYTNTLTTIDTASGYIWMPLTGINDENQWGVYACTVSILATPLDFRIYMDFGGKAVGLRREYYDFLETEQYQIQASLFIDKPHFYVFDTEWFSYITKKESMRSWLNSQRLDIVNSAREEVANYTETFSKQITWNRMLHGYIFDRSYIAKEGVINLDLIQKHLFELIDFYIKFTEFRKQRGNDAHIPTTNIPFQDGRTCL